MVETESAEPADASDPPDLEFYGGRAASAVPLAVFVAWAIFQSGVLGVGDTQGLVVGMLVGLIAGLFLVRGSWKDYADTIFDGMTQRVAATAVVAWLWAGMFANVLRAGQFVNGLVWAADVTGVAGDLFPALTFVLAALLATGIGTGYGTAITFTTVVFPAGLLLGANPTLLFAAILSGAVFGDNLAPVSDTTIVSAVTQDADIGGVVSSRLKYALVAAVFAFAAYVLAGLSMSGIEVTGAGTSLAEQANVAGLVHLVSMGVVIVTAIRGRHIVEAVSWGLLTAVVANLALGLSSLADIVVFVAPAETSLASEFAWLPIVRIAGPDESVAVGGALYDGAVGFFPLIVLTLLIVAAAEIMIRGGGFEAILDFLIGSVATTVRRAELTMVLGTALVNGMITINTAAEIAIAPYIARLGGRFNLNGYRRANILDANTSALGYIFPWGGGLLAGYGAMTSLTESVPWFTEAMVVNPVTVWPYVFHGWFLVAVFVFAAWTGYGREYVHDRQSAEVERV
ncbi:Na+/H+ antiporter NhaC family protein [Haloarchaeobius litoreus]|uniref:Na+/H+ antiporter NhaC family protein n=1 Tax=Haloarchaeobius litoreus TaxID=755306 RepID=A0ABD6DIU8_9EURY|nr:Na+/H+ antiporter NhaC family protein [Haloarchaeobius litoreus]